MSIGITIVPSGVTFADSQEIPVVQQNEEIVVNELVDNGYLSVDNTTQTVKITEKYRQDILNSIDLNQYDVSFTDNSVTISSKFSVRAFSGVNKIVYTWKGFDLYLDSTNANKIVAGSGLAAVAAMFVPDLSLSKALAVLLGTVGGVVSWNNAAGRGVIISFVGKLPSATPHWITSQ